MLSECAMMFKSYKFAENHIGRLGLPQWQVLSCIKNEILIEWKELIFREEIFSFDGIVNHWWI